MHRTVSRQEIATLLGLDPTGPTTSFSNVSAIETATATSIVFAQDPASLAKAKASAAGLILAGQPDPDSRILPVREPRLAFAQVYTRYFDERGRNGIASSAIVEDGAVLGENCEIGAGAFIASGARLGAFCVIGPRAVIHAACTLGERVRVQAGAILGSDGFGYAHAPEGYIGFPQIGTLVIGDDVEIGANTTIDRGALGETRIGRGTKIDNLVQIAHNCIIGQDVIIAAQVGLAGSITVEDGAMLGGQVGLGERVTIGRGVILGGQGGVLPGKRLDGPGQVFWGTPARPVRDYLRDLARLRNPRGRD